jgi:hypothetical protein
VGHRADGPQHGLRVRLFEDVTAPARLERGKDKLVVLEHGAKDDAHVGHLAAQGTSCFHAVQAGHLDIHEDDVGHQHAGLFQGLLTRAGLALNSVWSYGPRKTPLNGRATLERLKAIPNNYEVGGIYSFVTAHSFCPSKRRNGKGHNMASVIWP